MPLKQRSTEWRRLRLGDVTASRFGDVLTKPRTKAEEWSKTAESYLNELLSELIHCVPGDKWRSDATDWGTAQEPEAFARAIPAIEAVFHQSLDMPVGEFAYIHHPTEPYIGCSPDGIIGDDGLLELKCPYNGAKWIAAKRRRLTLPKENLAQVQGQLWVTGRKWTAFCYFDPRVQASGLDPLFIVWVERDAEYIEKTLAPRVLSFRDYLRSEYDRLVNNKEPF